MPLRRQHIIILLQAFLALFVFVSCTDDRIANDYGKDTSMTSGAPGYLTFRVMFDKDPASNRALNTTDSSSGSYVQDDEHILNGRNYLLLFDGDKKFLEAKPLPLDNDTKTDDYIEIKYKAQLNPRNDEVNPWPTYCLLVLNVNDQIQGAIVNGLEEGDDMDEALSIVFNAPKTEEHPEGNPRDIGYSDKEHKFFTMSNSIYVKRVIDEETNEIKNELITATYIDPEQITDNPNDEHNIMTIYVERMLAKCTFQIMSPEDENAQGVSSDSETQVENADNLIFPKDKTAATSTPLIFFAGIDDEEATLSFVEVRQWRVKVTGWQINALERQNYLFKKIYKDKNYFSGWIEEDATKYRSYWSEDLHYDYQDATTIPWEYPLQNRKAIDEPKRPYYQHSIEETKMDNNLLKNYSYNELELGNLVFDNVIYVPENTYDANVVSAYCDSREELLAGTHLLVGAELQISTNELDKYPEGWRTYDVYRDRNGLYYYNQKDCFVSLVHSFNHLLMSQNVMKFVPYDWVNGGGIITQKNGKTISPEDPIVAKIDGTYMLCLWNRTTREYDVLDDETLVKIMKMNDWDVSKDYGGIYLATAMLRNGDGQRLPWISSIDEDTPTMVIKKVKKENEKYVIDTTSDHHISIHKRGVNKHGATIAGDELWGNADADDIKSLLYEWLGAIDHFYDGKMYYARGINNPLSKDDNEERYGVVRNNWYQFNLREIKSLGTPIDDPNQPIIPDKVKNKDQINVTVKIIPWHNVETTVPLF